MMARSVRGSEIVPALRGGDSIFNRRGVRVTLAVAWEKPNEKKKYGLTVAHLMASVVPFGRELGEPIFAIDSDMPVGWTDEGIPVYIRIPIGRVVSIDYDTDSLIFEFDNDIQIEPMAVTVPACCKQMESSSNSNLDVHHIEFPDHNISSMQVDVPKGTRLMGFGCSQQRVVGTCTNVYSRHDETRSKMKFVFDEVFGRHHRSCGDEREADRAISPPSGDEPKDNIHCGLLYIDQDGETCCMHSATRVTRNGVVVSFAVGLREILKSHASYFYSHQSRSVSSSAPEAPSASAQTRRRSYLMESSDYVIMIDPSTEQGTLEDYHVQTVPMITVKVEEKGLFEPSPERLDSLYVVKVNEPNDIDFLESESSYDAEGDPERQPDETSIMPSDLFDDDDDNIRKDGTVGDSIPRIMGCRQMIRRQPTSLSTPYL
jgi:hypothetical protein